jgi:hypothetical protein
VIEIDKELLESLRDTAQAALLTAQSCLKAIELIQAESKADTYVTLETAASLLGEGISIEMLKERCADGRFTHGKEFVNTSDGGRSTYRIKVKAVRKFFETHPSKRVPPSRKAAS